MSEIRVTAPLVILKPLLAWRHTAILLRVLAALGLIILLAEATLRFSGLQRVERFIGPFEADVVGSAALVVHLNNSWPLRYLFDSGGDTAINPYRSKSVVTANGGSLGPAHSLHSDIRTGAAGAGAYSHWNDAVLFSMPGGVDNDSEVTVTVAHAWSLRDDLIAAAAIFLPLSLILLALRKRIVDRLEFDRLVLKANDLFLTACGVVWTLGLFASVVYLASVVLGWFDGWYLPNTAIFSYQPWTVRLAELEPLLAQVILLSAAFGAVLTWLAPAADMRRGEERLVRGFGRFGLVFLLGLFLLSVGASWFGVPRIQDLNGNAVAGLVPFNDAAAHFAGTFLSSADGLWNDFASRRPLAAALRGLGMLLVGYTNAHFLMLQVVLLAIATFAAARSIMLWRGLWAGMTFLGLSIILVRPYLSTNLTEPLGILLAMASVPYLVRALSTGALAAKGTAFLLTGLALSVRMGNMLAVPAIGLWMLLSGGFRRRAFANNLAVVLGILFVTGALTWSLSAAFGAREGEVGSNFAYVFCGLTHGGNWTTCDRLYEVELRGLHDEGARADVLYGHGLEMLVDQPQVLANRLVQNALDLIEALPVIVLQGYVGEMPNVPARWAWLCVVVVGLVRFIRNRGMARSEQAFWWLFAVSLVGSAAIIYADDGPRVLCVSYPILFMLISTAFASLPKPGPVDAFGPAPDVSRLVPFGAVAVILVGCFLAPWLAYQRDLVGIRALEAKETAGDVYLPSRYMAGFIVLPDGAERRKDVPSVFFSDFRQIIGYSGIQQYGNIETPAPPFGFVFAPGLVQSGGTHLIVPAEVLLNQAAQGWRFTYASGSVFRIVEQADAIVALP